MSASEDVKPEDRARIEAGCAALSRADVDTWLELVSEDFELLPVRGLVEGTRYRGDDGMRRFFDDIHRDWESLEVVPERMWAVGGRVVAATRVTGRMRGSGLEVSQLFGQVFEIEEARARSLETFATPEDALSAARDAAGG